MDLGHVVTSPFLADKQSFTIIRSTGQFAAGGFQSTTRELEVSGVVNVATERELRQVPEGDRPQAGMKFVSRTEMLTTRTAPQGAGVSDIIIWRGQQWRVVYVGVYPQRGFFTAIGTRIGGTVQE